MYSFPSLNTFVIFMVWFLGKWTLEIHNDAYSAWVSDAKFFRKLSFFTHFWFSIRNRHIKPLNIIHIEHSSLLYYNLVLPFEHYYFWQIPLFTPPLGTSSLIFVFFSTPQTFMLPEAFSLTFLLIRLLKFDFKLLIAPWQTQLEGRGGGE